MRIAYHSVSPFILESGYGKCTKELAYRLLDDFEVDIYAYYGLQKCELVAPLDGAQGDRLVRIIGNDVVDIWHTVLEQRAKDYDLVISHTDSWLIGQKVEAAGGRWVAWVIGDHDPVPWGLRRFAEAKNVKKLVPMSKWFHERLMRASDISRKKIAEPIYHGIDLEFWHKVDEPPFELPKGTEFFVVTVASNYGPRENIPVMIEGFALFLKRTGANAYYYVHAEPVRDFGFNLLHVCSQVEEAYQVPLKGRIGFKIPNQKYPDEWMRALYSFADVHLLVPLGGSFEIPIIESGACETPSITSEFSAPGEIVGYGERGLCVPPKAPVWMNRTSSRQYAVDPSDIALALEVYYSKPDLRREHGRKMREWIEKNCTWDQVAERWKKLIRKVAREEE